MHVWAKSIYPGMILTKFVQNLISYVVEIKFARRQINAKISVSQAIAWTWIEAEPKVEIRFSS